MAEQEEEGGAQDQGVEPGRVDAYGCSSNRPVDRRASSHKNDRMEVKVVYPLPPLGMPSSLGCTEVPVK